MEIREESGAPAANNASSNIGVDELDEETAKILRGDLIGDTAYSERFVLNTLIQFSDLKWNAEVEDNLCFLWDMTEEQDVCQYLLHASYPSLACSAIENYNIPRFIEIVVGIFGNILCSKCEKNIRTEDIKTVLNLWNSDDPYILIQVMRFVHAVAYMYPQLDFVEGPHLDRFVYILGNSVNKDLLTQTLKALAAITVDTKVNEDCLKGELLLAAVTACRVFKGNCETECDYFDSQEQQSNVKHFIQIVCNLCQYVDISSGDRIKNELNSNLPEFIKEVVVLLNYYKNEDNLLPINGQIIFYMEALTYICKVLKVVYVSSIAKALYEIFRTVYRQDLSNLEVVAELFCYFISVGNSEVMKADFENASLIEITEILSYIERRQFNFDFDYINNIKMTLAEFTTIDSNNQ